jgi:hypothetical protein
MAAKSEPDHKAAKDACDAKSGAEKDKCLKDAQMARDKAIKGSSSSSSSRSTKDTSSSSSSNFQFRKKRYPREYTRVSM